MQLVVGTAGHIDHGKTTLLRALTGVDLDRSPAERARGITIDLGFTHLDRPSGRRLAFVDAPGHERLVQTMIGGACGLDAALLCVSSVEGVKPQTREHLLVLDRLGVRVGVVALTFADLADAELIALARLDVEAALAGTTLTGAQVVAVSAKTGAGLPALLDALDALVPAPREARGPARLPIDRSFSRPGFGTVVTGTLQAGTLEEGQALTLWPSGLAVRVRGLHHHGQAVGRAEPGWRVAVNLVGATVAQAPRGAVLSAGALPAAQVIDVLVRPAAGVVLAEGMAVRALCGTASAVGRLHLMAEAGEQEVPAQLRLAAPLPCWPGDAWVLRMPAPPRTLGGGRIVDPWAPRLRRARAAQHVAELRALASGEAGPWLLRAGEAGLLQAVWEARAGGAEGVLLGDRVVHARVADQLVDALAAALARFHRAEPLQPGALRRDLRGPRFAHLSERGLDAVIRRAVRAGRVVEEGGRLRAPKFSVKLAAEAQAGREALRQALAEAGLAGLDAPAGPTRTLLAVLERAGEVRVVPGLGFVLADVLDALIVAVRAHLSATGALTPGEFKQISGQSRRAAIPLLEWLDAQGLTRRVGDGRVPGQGF